MNRQFSEKKKRDPIDGQHMFKKKKKKAQPPSVRHVDQKIKR